MLTRMEHSVLATVSSDQSRRPTEPVPGLAGASSSGAQSLLPQVVTLPTSPRSETHSSAWQDAQANHPTPSASGCPQRRVCGMPVIRCPARGRGSLMFGPQREERAEGRPSLPACLILGLYHLGLGERSVYTALHLFPIIHQYWQGIVPCSCKQPQPTALPSCQDLARPARGAAGPGQMATDGWHPESTKSCT